MNRAVVLSVVLSSVGAVTAACSGSSVSGTGGAGGAGGAEPAAGGAGGTLPAQGNLTLIVQPPSSSSGPPNCPVPGLTYVIGNPDGPNGTSPGDRVIDGERGAKVKCSVQGNGPYSVSGTIQGLTPEGESVTLIIMNGVIDADKRAGSARITVNTPQLAGDSNEAGCTLSVIAQQIKPGSLWATVFCPSITSPTTGQSCSVGSLTTFVLENCEGS